MKNLNIMGVRWKIRFFKGGHKKPICRGELPEKGELGQFAHSSGGGGGPCQRRGGVDTPMHIMNFQTLSGH